MYPMIGSDWFETVENRESSLTKLNCDVILNWILLKAFRAPKGFLERWSVFDSRCWDVISGPTNSSELEKTLVSFLFGIDPLQRPLSWLEVDQIYGIAHFESNLYSVYCVHLRQQKIVVYDSMNWPHCKQLFEAMASCIQKLSVKYQILNDGARRWDVILCDVSPRQRLKEDCGVVCLKVIE